MKSRSPTTSLVECNGRRSCIVIASRLPLPRLHNGIQRRDLIAVDDLKKKMEVGGIGLKTTLSIKAIFEIRDAKFRIFASELVEAIEARI